MWWCCYVDSFVCSRQTQTLTCMWRHRRRKSACHSCQSRDLKLPQSLWKLLFRRMSLLLINFDLWTREASYYRHSRQRCRLPSVKATLIFPTFYLENSRAKGPQLNPRITGLSRPLGASFLRALLSRASQHAAAAAAHRESCWVFPVITVVFTSQPETPWGDCCGLGLYK